MPIDIRATVTCSLGTLISGSINDDYVQGTGLIKTRGSVELSGIVTPAIGTAVTFSYTKGGTTRSIPRKLRVLSSFADPFRRTTKVELGCKLTYLSDLREAIDWKAFDDTANDGYTEADAEIITLPISAASVMSKCLSALGITASSSPLTNKFSVEKFDLSPGYVNVLSDLLVSESYCGYLDTNEVLQVFSLDQPGGSGPVLDKAKIIDLGSIGVGQLPGEAVTVSYSTLKLQKPEVVQENTGGTGGVRPGWDRVTTTNIFDVKFPYSLNGSPAVAIYRVEENTVVTTDYITIRVGTETKRVVSRRVTMATTMAPAVAGALITEYLSNGINFNGSPTVYKNTYETYRYDAAGNQTFYSRYVEGSAWYVIGSLGLPFVFSPNDYVDVFWGGIVPIEREIQRGLVAGDYQNVTTDQYGSWFQTINGQQTIAAARSAFSSSTQVAAFINSGLPIDLILLDSRVSIQRRTEPETSPSVQAINNAANAKDGDPNNGWRTSSTSELELALGSATAQRRIELSLPYAPDDIFTGPSGGPFSSQASDAPQKAKRFGVVQNRLLLGNRSGMNIQCAPEHLPAAPFSAFVVTANGLSGLYRTNGTSWTLSSEGVIVSTDALFWGAVGTSEGATGDFWFPVAPGITELPFTPPAVDGVVTVPGVVPVWNETALILGRTRHVCTITGLAYALQQTTPLVLRTRTAATVIETAYINVPAAAVTVAALAPVVSGGASVAVPVAAVTVAALAPVVASGASVAIPAAGITVAGVAPDLVGRQRTQVLMPVAGVSVAGLAPLVAGGASVAVPVAGVSMAVVAPASAGATNPIPALSPVLWYDFADEATVAVASSQITQITDKGSRGWTLTKSATGPAYVTGINGRKCADWGTDGHSNYLANTNTTSTSIAEVFIVLDANFGSTFPTLNGLISATASGWILVGNNGGAGFWPYSNLPSWLFDSAFINGSTSNVYDSAILPDINSPVILRMTRTAGPLTANDGFVIGNDRTFYSRGWGGLIGEVVVFSSVLSSTDRAAVQGWLAGKWGISLV